MKIGILGTRGIPNNYGGFEQFAEQLAVDLVLRNHQVWVYNSSTHVYQQKLYNGVRLIHCNDPEEKMGTIGQFFYDFNCIVDSRKQQFDIILQLGYTSSSVWHWLLPKKSIIITNMDGLEWKRSKYSAAVKWFLRFAEKWAVQSSDALVADSIGIKSYLKATYNADSTYIAYAAKPVYGPSANLLAKYSLQKWMYCMLIARMEPENNIEIIIDGYLLSEIKVPLLVVGNHTNKYGAYLYQKYASKGNVRWLGAIYDINQLNALRWFAYCYFHGHSVGGTNPSLLEAMASRSAIIAHNNPFNKGVLGNDALFFDTSQSLADHLKKPLPDFEAMKQANFEKICEQFSPKQITDKYENLMQTCSKIR